MNKCAVVIPIYKKILSRFEITNLRISLHYLQGNDIYFLTPENLHLDFLNHKFKNINFKKFPDFNFTSITNYSKLMLSVEFYESFNSYSHLLVCQTDAIVISPYLSYWLEQPYDYIGAPWPNGYELTINTTKIPVIEGIRCRAFVGNGGLSLRRIKECLHLFNEFHDVHQQWINAGHAEDLFFGLTGYLSKSFRLPSLMTAAHFSHETEPEFLYRLIGNKLPFGAHGFDKYQNIHLANFMKEFLITHHDFSCRIE